VIARARRGPAPAGRPSTSARQDANVTTDGIPQARGSATTSGTLVRLDADAERFAAEVVERVGPARALDLAEALVAMLRDLDEQGGQR
jgi:hypothetical protein